MKHTRFLAPPNGDRGAMPWCWIGTWRMGGEHFGPYKQETALQTLALAYENGIRYFDTAGFYGHGQSEALLKKAFHKKRDQVFIASKGGLRWTRNHVKKKADPSSLREDLENSLKRLNTNHIDLFQLHWPDPTVPLLESIMALKTFQKEGKIRQWGVCNLTNKELQALPKMTVNIPHQITNNPLQRQDLEQSPSHIAHIAVSPLAEGLLGNSNSQNGRVGLAKKDHRHKSPLFQDLQAADKIKSFKKQCIENGISTVSGALLWNLSQPHIAAIMPGPRTPKQLQECLEHQKFIGKTGLFIFK